LDTPLTGNGKSVRISSIGVCDVFGMENTVNIGIANYYSIFLLRQRCVLLICYCLITGRIIFMYYLKNNSLRVLLALVVCSVLMFVYSTCIIAITCTHVFRACNLGIYNPITKRQCFRGVMSSADTSQTAPQGVCADRAPGGPVYNPDTGQMVDDQCGVEWEYVGWGFWALTGNRCGGYPGDQSCLN
jgi:hypothetical protein